ncbi:MerR family transcriptional regulator [Rhodococcus sp. SMB37]|uniref:MerR family transcriptional regulator n=1 Tax=Rhodococcus sp. SMB37 TaxID=2512213 RepID=UPI0006CF69AF|nr:MerR family transcriptional regulator [Rhodococcus sp. SMB37]
MTDRTPWMSIGEFAQACRLTVKALRYYDREELLTPGRVDPHTGYRYYAPAQLATALRIGLLRRAGVSIASIRRIVDDPARSADVLAVERARIEHEAERALRSLALVGSLEEIAATELPVRVRRIDDQVVLWREGSADVDDLDRTVAASIESLLVDAAVLGVDTDAPVVGRYPVVLEGTVDFGVGIEVAPDVGADAVLMPGGLFAAVDFTGPASLLPVAYHALFADLAARGVEAVGPVREYYLTDPAEVGAENMLTRVVHHVSDPDAKRSTSPR